MSVGLSLDCFASGSESKKGRETILHKHFLSIIDEKYFSLYYDKVKKEGNR
jgi:hypothetical protein